MKERAKPYSQKKLDSLLSSFFCILRVDQKVLVWIEKKKQKLQSGKKKQSPNLASLTFYDLTAAAFLRPKPPLF